MVVGEGRDFRLVLFNMLKGEGFEVKHARDKKEALRMASIDPPDVVVLDVGSPEVDGIEALGAFKQLNLDIPIIMTTEYGETLPAVEAIRSGAFEYFAKPVDNGELVSSIRRALKRHPLVLEQAELLQEGEDRTLLTESMGTSVEIRNITKQVSIVAATNFSVLLQGETGTGKELVAHAIHRCSARKDGPFIALDCGALPETLFESELFGYERGSFTGAYSRRKGYFELADGGTLFLDEVTNLSPSAQAKLLRVLEEREIRRLGAKDTVGVDVRLIVASNKPLEIEVESGKFRQDLYHRLREFVIWVPPLRERKEDIVFLAKKFLAQTSQELGRKVQGFTDEATGLLLSYDWPGNARELKNVMKRATLLSDGAIEPGHLSVGRLTPSHVPLNTELAASIRRGLSLREIKEKAAAEVERQVIKQVLKMTEGNKSKAASILKVHYKNLHDKIKKYGIKDIVNSP